MPPLARGNNKREEEEEEDEESYDLPETRKRGCKGRVHLSLLIDRLEHEKKIARFPLEGC